MKNLKMPDSFAAISKDEQVNVNGGYVVRTRVTVRPARRNAPPPRGGGPNRVWFTVSFAELFAGVAAMLTVFNPFAWFSFGSAAAASTAANIGTSTGGVSSIKAEYDAIKLF